MNEITQYVNLLGTLSQESTVDFYLLRDDSEIAKMFKAGKTYEEILEYVAENY